MDKLMVDQRELEYLTGIPVKVIEQYTSDRYWKDWHAKKVKVPPLPMVEFGGHTKRFILARVVAWAEENFSGPEARKFRGIQDSAGAGPRRINGEEAA